MEGDASDTFAVGGCCKGGTGQRADDDTACTAQISSKESPGLIIGSPTSFCTVDSRGWTVDPGKLLTPTIDIRPWQHGFAAAAGRARGLT